MNVLDAETTATIRESLEQVFLGEPTMITNALADLGWSEVVEADPVTARYLLFEAQGRALATSRLLDDVVFGELGHVFDGVTTVVAYRNILLGPLSGAKQVLLLDDHDVSMVPAADAGNHVHLVHGFDHHAGWYRLGPGDLRLTPLDIDRGRITAAVAATRLALSAELIGVCETALRMGIDHTSARYQYGRPLASFQVVRHALAESHAAIEHAKATLRELQRNEGAACASAARIAKYRAGATQALVMRHAIQVHGAMGLTLENDVHRAVSRAAALDALMGSYRVLGERLGRELLEGDAPLRFVEI